MQRYFFILKLDLTNVNIFKNVGHVSNICFEEFNQSLIIFGEKKTDIIFAIN